MTLDVKDLGSLPFNLPKFWKPVLMVKYNLQVYFVFYNLALNAPKT